MGENLPLSVKLDDNPNGTVSFANDVIATMAGLATTEVEGVNSMYSASNGFSDIFGRSKTAKGNHTKGVRVEVLENKIAIDISIVVDYGTPVPTIAREIQENVKKTVENMSGLDVSTVDVHIMGISFEKEKEAQLALAEQQKAAMLESSATKSAEVPPVTEEPKTEDEAPAENDNTPEEDAGDDDDDYELILEDDPEEEEVGDSDVEEDEERPIFPENEE